MTRRGTTGRSTRALWIALSLTIALLGGASVAVAPTAAANASIDGSIITGCGTVENSGTYELGGDLMVGDAGTCLGIEGDDITIDGVDNDSRSYDVEVRGADVTVRDLTLSGFEQGVRVGGDADSGDRFLGRDLTVRDNDVYGVAMFATREATLEDSRVAANGETGIYTTLAGDTLLARNDVDGDNGGSLVLDGTTADVGPPEVNGVTVTDRRDGRVALAGREPAGDRERLRVREQLREHLSLERGRERDGHAGVRRVGRRRRVGARPRQVRRGHRVVGVRRDRRRRGEHRHRRGGLGQSVRRPELTGQRRDADRDGRTGLRDDGARDAARARRARPRARVHRRYRGAVVTICGGAYLILRNRAERGDTAAPSSFDRGEAVRVVTRCGPR